MIINRTPFRISFSGGGSDLAAFYTQHEGCVLSTSINKYMYIIAHPFAVKDQIQVKYSKTELADYAAEIKHPIIRKVLEVLGINTGIEIASFADISAGTGLGSSSSFTVGVLHCLNSYLNNYVSKEYLAQNACRIEIDELKEPIGKQDQYAAAFGGLNFIQFKRDGSVQVEPIMISKERIVLLQNNLLLFFTGSTRTANSILSEQKQNMSNHKAKLDNLIHMTELTRELKNVLYSGDLDNFGRILSEGWQLKQTLASKISNDRINFLYEKGIKQGKALGGKLLGAGGAGYLLFYCPLEYQSALRNAMQELTELHFTFDFHGSNIIFYDNNVTNLTNLSGKNR